VERIRAKQKRPLEDDSADLIREDRDDRRCGGLDSNTKNDI
jgi:hypothetical protein